MPEAIGSPVYNAMGKELTGVPYHVDRRRALYDAKRVVAGDQLFTQAVHRTGCRDEKHTVVWDEATRSYHSIHALNAPDLQCKESSLKLLEPELEPESIPQLQRQPEPRQVCHREGGEGDAVTAVSKLRTTLLSQQHQHQYQHQHQQPDTAENSPGEDLATLVNTQVPQVRADQFQRRQNRLVSLRKAAAAAQSEADKTAREQILFAAVTSGNVGRLERLGLWVGIAPRKPEPGMPSDLGPEQEPTTGDEGIASMAQLSDSDKPTSIRNQPRTLVHAYDDNCVGREGICPLPPAALSIADTQRWRKGGLPRLSPPEVEALLTARNSCGQTPLALAQDRGQMAVYDHLVQVLVAHLATAVPESFGAAGGGTSRIDVVKAMVAMLPARMVRRSAFYDDWMALEEYYKLLLREAAEDRVAQAKAEALAKRRKAEESAATRRRRREAARSRRTEAEELHAQQEAALVKAKADKQVEAKVAAALEEADQARKKAEMEAEAATWAAQRLKRRVKKRMQKGGWRLNASGFEQLGADGGPRDAATRTGGAENGGGDGVSEELMFFDSVATEVL
jgi:hypothetical protein